MVGAGLEHPQKHHLIFVRSFKQMLDLGFLNNYKYLEVGIYR